MPSSGYTKLTGEEEDRRLQLQNHAVRYFDESVYRRVFGQYAAPRILDVGCGNGDMITYMTDESPACTIWGIDIVKRQIELAAERHPEGHFHVLDIEQDCFLEEMHDHMGAEGISGFDVINCSMVLMHLADPVGALKKLKSILADGGTLIVREVDDGIQRAFPDPENRFGKLLDIIAGDNRLGDRHCGRKVYSYLKNAGFSLVRLEKEGLSNISIPDRKLLYEMAIPAFFDYMKSRTENEPDNTEYRKAYEWYAANLDEISKSFEREDFFISLGFMSFTAM